MKLSEELRLRNVEVGDVYAYTKDMYRDTDVFLSTSKVDTDGHIENLLSGQYDKDKKFLWLVDINGNKKERMKEAVNERVIHELPSHRDREAVKYCEMEDEIDFDAENYGDDDRKHNIKFLAFVKGWDQGIAWDIANKEKVK